MFRLIIVLILALLLTSCAFHGPNIELELVIDKSGRTESTQEPALTQEEYQEVLGYIREAAKLLADVMEEREIAGLIREIDKPSSHEMMLRSLEFLKPSTVPRPRSPVEEFTDGMFRRDPLFE